jgi:ACS family allantoate permease-like MFS transporter
VDPGPTDYDSILGSALIYATDSIATRYAGLLLMGVYSVSMPLSLAMVASNIGGFSKRATVSAIYFVMYCTGNIVGPQLFFEREAPRYQVCYARSL